MFFFFSFLDSIQVQLRPANGSPTQRWVLSRVQNDYDERLELLHRIGRFLGPFWGFSLPERDTLTILTIVILLSSVVYADEPVYFCNSDLTSWKKKMLLFFVISSSEIQSWTVSYYNRHVFIVLGGPSTEDLASFKLVKITHSPPSTWQNVNAKENMS